MGENVIIIIRRTILLKIFNIKYLFALWIGFSVTFAQWLDDPEDPQMLGSGIQPQVRATSDGGVYIAWLTDMGGYHVYLQWFNSEGIAQFDDGGMLVSDNNNASWIAVYHLNLAVDSEDNAIITLVDQRTGPWEVYAYKVSSDGDMLWGAEGLTLSDSGIDNISPRLAVLPDNSVVVTWSKNYSSIMCQRISPNGNLLWGDGVAINNLIADLLSPHPIISSEGELLIQWISQTGPIWAADSKLNLQKYDLDGSSVWGEPTVVVGPVVFPMGNWLQQSVADGNNGSFSAWTQMSGNVQSAAVQHITDDGGLSWVSGVNLSANSSNFRMSPRLVVAENSQDLIAVWNESNGSQSQRGVYAQRIDESGNRLWGMNGTAIVPLNNTYDYLDLSIIGLGEDLITAFVQQSPNMNGNIYAIRLDANGNSIWSPGNVVITNSNTSKTDMMVGKGIGCLFIAWSENGNVYAHCLREDGTLGSPEGLLLGDINNDGNIDVLDVVMLVGHILNPDTSELESGDINGDGSINVLDVVALVSMILRN